MDPPHAAQMCILFAKRFVGTHTSHTSPRSMSHMGLPGRAPLRLDGFVGGREDVRLAGVKLARDALDDPVAVLRDMVSFERRNRELDPGRPLLAARVRERLD